MVLSSVASHVRRLRADERGAVSVMMGFLIIPLVGALALGFEASNWYLTTRGMQNAADAAALAAATNAGWPPGKPESVRAIMAKAVSQTGEVAGCILRVKPLSMTNPSSPASPFEITGCANE